MTNILPSIDQQPYALYRADQVREFDRIAIEEYGIPGRVLMERAGAAAFGVALCRWPGLRDLTVLCGIGNNGGDGYVVARLALEAGLPVRVLQFGEPERLKGDALGAAEAYRAIGGPWEPFDGLPADTDLIVDGVFGTGLEREVTGAWRAALESVNRHPAPVLALDLPSGLHSDSGHILGVAVEADVTVCFIALKQGLFTGDGPAVRGKGHFDALGVPAAIYARQVLSARRIDWDRLGDQLTPRGRTAHKGMFGHLLVIGGDLGMPGAARLAAEGAARAGAGLVSVATRPEHAATLNLGRPELMCRGVEGAADLTPLIDRADVIAVGPGLGRSEWSRSMLDAALASGRPLVVDADALNLLASTPQRRDDWVLTPHPGEASRLLGCSAAELERDRFGAVEQLQDRWGGVAVLKGAGTLVLGPGQRPVAVCSDGNPGMASGGMGDLLTGIIGALIGQGYALSDAAEFGVALHAAAADRAALEGERGMLASDLLPWVRRLANGAGASAKEAEPC